MTSSVQDILVFIKDNDGYKRAFKDWTERDVMVALSNSSYKKYMTYDNLGKLVSLVIAKIEDGNVFRLVSIIIRKDVRAKSGVYFGSLAQQFLKYYDHMMMVTKRRDKQVIITYKTLLRLCKKANI